jgi:hypothetical protein
VRPTRSLVEYAWTAVPVTCRYVLAREDSISTVTYLDADLFFFGSPQPMFDELGHDSILVVPHRMPDPRDELAPGKYNVGWVTLRRDASGTAALDSWRERCLDWCYERVEPGRFGDQKYLEDWPRRFERVKVSQNTAAGLAPWNQTSHELESSTHGSLVADGRPVVFFHYSGLTLHQRAGALATLARRSGAYRLTDPFVWTVRARHSPRLLDVVWEPYVERCAAAHAELVGVGAPASLGLKPLSARAVAGTIARERSPTVLRDAHLAVHRRVMEQKATRGPRRPGSRSALPPR